MQIHAKHILLGDTWAQDVRVTCHGGKISAIQPGVPLAAEDYSVDVLLPALANLHSHSFQRAMAGMTEFRTAGQDSFWTWRALMYRFLEHLTPEHYEAIAALVFMEMQEAGYASVGEFHYVHHQKGGAVYDALGELSHRVFAAADHTGIGLTHLPVLYTYGGVNQEALAGGQLRFSNDLDRFLALHQACADGLKPLADDSQLGVAPHSLRATTPADLDALLAAVPGGPVHMHIAEQRQEVADVQAKFGARPVAWLLDNAKVDGRWCLIHATHMTEEETHALANTRAVAGLCPITEANLGDGAFNGPSFLAQAGRFGVGSDSNVRISLTEELRTLEYSQRLRDEVRNVMVAGSGSVGHALYTNAARGSAQALARDAGTIEVGKLADLVALDRSHPSLCALRDTQLLDGLVFAAPDQVVTDLWSAGRHRVKGGQHISRSDIVTRYRKAITDLIARADA